MLLSFSLANFRSYAEEQELSMVAGRYPDHPEHLFPVPGSEDNLLRAAVIYGANGSGKSNLIKGLRFAQQLVLTGTQPEKPIPRQAFRLKPTAENEPTLCRMRFVQEGIVFDYGFKVTDKEVLEEWLFVLRGTREQAVFERVSQGGTTNIEAGPALTDAQYGDQSKVVALGRIGVRANQLFLAAIREGLNPSDHGVLMRNVLEWVGSLAFVMPNWHFDQLAQWIAGNNAFATFASRFLNEAATGVSALRMDSRELDENSGLPSELVKQVLSDAQPGEARPLRWPGFGPSVIQRTPDGGKVLLKTIRAEHMDSTGRPVAFSIADESDGTQRLLYLLPALFQLQGRRRIYIIDEIDRSLHPLLAKKFIEFFLKACGTKQGQLILTTHESHLMDLDMLRRDELWFTEKNPEGATNLYSLADFKVRTDLKIDKGYLHGRFGAIPFLGKLDQFAVESSVASEAACR